MADLEASMVELRRLHEWSLANQKQIDELKKKIQELETEKQKTDEIFEERLLQHAQADCRQLVSMMYAKLPAELRSMIYSYLYLEEAQIPIGSYHFTSYVDPKARDDMRDLIDSIPRNSDDPVIVVPKGAIKQDHRVERPSNILFPDNRILDVAYLGTTVAYEVSKLYYSSNTFSICTIEDTLSNFLLKDSAENSTQRSKPWELLGLQPIDHIRNLQVRVKYEHYDENLNFYKFNREHEREAELIYDIFSNLKPLMRCTKREDSQRLNVEILIMTAFGQFRFSQPDPTEINRRLTNLFEAIRLSFYTLKYDLGAQVAVTHYDETSSPFPRTITGLFSLTTEQWSHEKSALKTEGVHEYSPLHYFIVEPRTRLNIGFSGIEVSAIMEQRWGFDNPVSNTQCKFPIREGPYWPFGRRSLTQLSSGASA